MSRRFAICFALAALAAQAQDPRGTITGQVTDSSDALVAGAGVRAINQETGTRVSTTSNARGTYEIPFLLPGTYRVEAELSGFKTWTRAGIELRMEDRLQLDIKLEVGGVEQVVEVTAEAPLLEAANANMTHTATNQDVSELPLRGDSVAALFATAPGVVLDDLPYDGPWNIQQNSSLAVAGIGRAGGGVDFRLDGISNNSYAGQTAFVPPRDMVQEVRISTNTYDASAGHSMGGGINISLKAGTNQLHGSAGALGMAGPLLTRNFFVNKYIFDPTTGPITPEKIHANTPAVRWMRYSAVVGGPVVIPRLYDGRNRTFWIFGMQIHNRQRPIAGYDSVPTPAERLGDFSEMLKVGTQYQIYDPLSGVPTSATRYQRSPFPGNIVPANRIHPAGSAIANLYPAPNTTGAVDGTDNYFRTRPEKQDLYQPEARVDHYFSERHRMFARYTHSDFHGHFDQWIPDSEIRGRRRQRPHRGVALDNVFVLGSGMVLDVRYGFTWFHEYESFDNQGYDLTQLGMPKSLIAQMDAQGITFPEIAVADMLQLGQNGGFSQHHYSHNVLASLNWVRGRHALKTGLDFSTLYNNEYNYGNVAPQMTFNGTYTRGPADNAANGPGYGQGFASLLLGIPSSGYSDINSSWADMSRGYGVYFQDDWRVNRSLTLNLGVRYEYESPVTERFNRSARDFFSRIANPVQNDVQQRYARSPIPQVPSLMTPGGVSFVGVNGNPRGFYSPYRKAVMPRVGLAWRVRRRMIMRTGYGIFFAPMGADFNSSKQPGFSQRTNIAPSLDAGLTFAASISNPFPGGLTAPAGASGGLATYLGRAPGFFPASTRRAYNQRWSYSLQFEPVNSLMVELGYIGSRATGLAANTDFNPIPREYLSTSPERDTEAINLLTANIPNPFQGVNGFQGSNYYTQINVQRQQLLKPFPQFTGLTAPLSAGMSWYHAFTARLDRRFRGGLRFGIAFTHSRTMEAVSYLNPTDSSPEHVLSALDRPNRISANAMWELPFGRGKALGRSAPAAINHIIGGWQAQTLWQNQSGPGLTFANVLYRGLIGDIALAANERKLERWFNTDGFELASGRQLAQNIRAFPSRISGARAAGISTVDVSLFKTVRIRERLRMQIRCEAEGIANHPNFYTPNTVPTNANFGQVTRTRTQQEERRISLGLKLQF